MYKYQMKVSNGGEILIPNVFFGDTTLVVA